MTAERYAQVAQWRDNPLYTQREKLAIEFAERFANDHRNIDGRFFERLRAEYTDVEVVELATFLARCLGFGRINKVLGLEEVCEIDP